MSMAMKSLHTLGHSILACMVVFLLVPTTLAQTNTTSATTELIVNGDFEAISSGKYLRRDDKGQDWYESRKDTEEGRGLLKLSTKQIGGNKTHKAMIKAHPELNTYLSQRFAEPLTGSFTVQYDIFVREILPDDNRSAFFFLGGIKDKMNGPNSTGSERFVFLGFENATAPGTMNLFAREGETKWDGKTIVTEGLELEKWYTVVIEVDVWAAVYRVMIEGVTDWFELESFYYRGKALDRVTHLSFASWNDGAGTFYVDNVSAHQ